jgi:hypothetical protein
MDKIATVLLTELKDLHGQYDTMSEIFYERSQLYGTLIQLLLGQNVNEVTFSYDDLKSSNNYILKFIPDNESKILTIQLMANPDKEEEEKDES